MIKKKKNSLAHENTRLKLLDLVLLVRLFNRTTFDDRFQVERSSLHQLFLSLAQYSNLNFGKILKTEGVSHLVAVRLVIRGKTYLVRIFIVRITKFKVDA